MRCKGNVLTHLVGGVLLGSSSHPHSDGKSFGLQLSACTSPWSCLSQEPGYRERAGATGSLSLTHADPKDGDVTPDPWMEF